MICDACAATSEETRTCPMCLEVNCRHDARNGVFGVDGEWRKVIVCRDPFECIKRHVKQEGARGKDVH